ncbi:MAG: terminase small subunit [Lachnospira sp.]|nr:terminase small subunit [Lachnospira sp.]
MAKKSTPPDGGAADSIKTTDISAITVNSAALEKIIGVSDRRIRQLAEENIIIRAAKGRYKLMDSVTNYILTLKVQMEANNADSLDGEIDLEEERAIHERVKRHISELKLQTMKGELHKSEDVERVMMDMLASVRAKLLSMPTKLAPILVSRSDIDFVRNTINREVMEALNELKGYNPKEFYSDEYVAIGDDGSNEREED